MGAASPRIDVQRRAARLRLQQGIARLALLAVSERDVQRLLDHAVAGIAEALCVDRVSLHELLPDGHTLVLRAATGAEPEGGGLTEPAKPATLQAGFTLQAGEPVIATALGAKAAFRLPRTQPVLGSATAASVPLFGRDPRPYGVLEVGAGVRPVTDAANEVADFLQGAGALIVNAVERARVEAACRFLAESEMLLVPTREFDESVVALAEMAVPRLGDWCCIDIVSPLQAIEPRALAHADPDVVRVGGVIRQHARADPDADAGVARVLRTGLTEFHVDLGAALSIRPEDHETLAELTAAAGFEAAMVVPLAARGHVFGAVTLVAQPTRRPFDGGDVLLAEAFAAHAALALDHVRLFSGEGAHPSAGPSRARPEDHFVLVDSDLLGSRLLDAVAEERILLSRVLDSVGLASRLGSEDDSVASEASDVAEAVRVAVEDVRPALSPAHDLEIAEPSVLATGDPVTLRRLVTCLVETAVAHSPGGGSVRVRLEVGKTLARLSVSEEGAAIPPGEGERLFDKGFHGGAARSAQAGGVGLGPTLLRELASRLHGTVEVAPGDRGTTLIVELPLEHLA